MRYPIMLSASVLAALALAAGPSVASATQHTAADKAQNKTEKAADKVEQKLEKAESKTKSTAREAKAGITDSWLTAKTKIALFADDRIKGRQVNVETNNGVVALRGTVDSEEAKTAAGEVAKGIEGVKSVKNDLRVVAPAQQKAVAADDKEITRQIGDRFSKDAKLKKVDVRADAGVVTLQGEVPTITDSARASQLAREIPGVRSVKNELKTDRQSMSDRPIGREARDDKVMRSRSDARVERSRAMGQEHVMRVQEALKEKGYNPGPSDGMMGPQTSAALREYQQKEGLQVTGRADAETLGKLGIGIGGTGAKRPQSP